MDRNFSLECILDTTDLHVLGRLWFLGNQRDARMRILGAGQMMKLRVNSSNAFICVHWRRMHV